MKELDEILSRVKNRNSKVTEFYSMSNWNQQYGSKTDPSNSSPYANDVPNQETTSDSPNQIPFYLPGKSGGDNSKTKTEKGGEGKEFPFINKLIKRDLTEATKDENAPDPNEAEAPTPAPEEPPGDAGGDPNLAMNDPAAAGGAPDPNVQDPNAMMDPSMGGMGGNVDPTTGMPIEDPSHLGRIYEIKKIYTRLTSIESYLSSEADEILVKIRGYVSQAIQLFEILASNLQTYKDKLDDIIIQYYKFLDTVFDLVKSRYKELKDKQK
jgi:hypothetical protein